MNRIWKGYQQHKDVVLALLGLLAVSLITLPYLVLGEGSYVQVHDQLDGEVLNYMYQAKYLGRGKVIPQFMNGMDKASMLPPAPLGVLFYRLLPPFAAYGVMHWFCLAVGFLGMYGLCRRLGIRAQVGWAAACLFCYIPFYPTYGLAALGQPMLVLCGLRLGEGAPSPGGRRKLLDLGRWYLAIALYAVCSSLTLIGYVWVAAGILWTAYLAVDGHRDSLDSLSDGGWPPKKNGFGSALRVGGGTLTLLGIYLITNLDLLRTLTGEGFTTHRQEMVLRAAEHPLTSFRELIFSGGSYSPVYSAGILAAAALLAPAVLAMYSRSRRKAPENRTQGAAGKMLRRRSGKLGTNVPNTHLRNGVDKAPDMGAEASFRAAWALIGLIFCGALLAVLWNSRPIVSLRLSIGGMVTYFQADRIYWCFPFLWMLVLGLLLESICRLGDRLWISPEKQSPIRTNAITQAQPAPRGQRKVWSRIIPVLCCLLLLAVEGLQILRDSPLNKNIRLMLLKNYRQVTWESIYMDEVFSRIDRVIGADKDDYSVVSLGIYPSVALYHGYTCADGYSNNYDLAYKHKFRQIMARELEENPESLRYFDEWGNRLYLTGAPHGINGMVAKNQSAYADLDYDLNAMQALNIRYILSAAPVELSQSALQQTALRLELVEGSPFTDDTAYYEVWVYRIAPFGG